MTAIDCSGMLKKIRVNRLEKNATTDLYPVALEFHYRADRLKGRIGERLDRVFAPAIRVNRTL